MEWNLFKLFIYFIKTFYKNFIRSKIDFYTLVYYVKIKKNRLNNNKTNIYEKKYKKYNEKYK